MATTRAGWLTPALRLQSAVATRLTTGFAIAALGGARFGSAAQMAVLVTGIVLVGFPHGAFDHLVGRRMLRPRLGRRWWVAFLAGYLGLAAVVGIGWVLAPATTLVLFLAASVLHFGLGDAEDGLTPRRALRVTGVLTYGALPILLPATLHATEAAPVLAALADVPTPAMQAALRAAAWLLPVWTVAFGWVLLAARDERRAIAERLVTAASFVLLPPLLAFGLYFATGHSVRHVLRLGAWASPNDRRKAAGWLARIMVPAAILSAAGIGGLAWLGRETVVDLLTPMFRLIAALTLPHMVVTSWLDRSRTVD